ncbi:MAG: tetratricopeptide repeat protein, partial [Polyangia bacterium]
MRLRLAVAAVVVVAAFGARADEDSPEKQQARMLLSQGNQLFEKGDLRAALADFRAAYALYPSPKLLVNAAAAERELGDLPGAATDLRHFLDDATEDDSSLVDKARSDLRSIEKKCGRIGLKGWPQRSTLEIDGRAARDPTYVKPGNHAIKVRSPSGIELDKDGDVAAGEVVEVAVPA